MLVLNSHRTSPILSATLAPTAATNLNNLTFPGNNSSCHSSPALHRSKLRRSCVSNLPQIWHQYIYLPNARSEVKIWSLKNIAENIAPVSQRCPSPELCHSSQQIPPQGFRDRAKYPPRVLTRTKYYTTILPGQLKRTYPSYMSFVPVC